MAVPSSSPSRSAKSRSPKPKVMKHHSGSKTKTKTKTKSECKNEINIDNQYSDATAAIPVPAPATKRTKDPGVRLVNGRIYDSQNGKTCHQCRQKTMDFTASCKNLKKGNLCPVRYCHKCLFNRYGEKAEETVILDDWYCPKCRGKCNCSFCRKKSGHKPTGILVHAAKASGFLSVSEMLDVRGPCIADDVLASPKKALDPKKDNITKKVHCSTSDLSVQKPMKRVHAQLRETSKKNMDNAGTNKSSEDKELQINEQASSLDPNDARKNKKNVGPKKNLKTTKSLKFKSVEEEPIKMNGISNNIADDIKNAQIKDNDSNGEPHDNIQNIRSKNIVDKEVEVELSLPLGNDSITVGGTDLPSRDAGQALQFLEFCAAIGKVFNMRKGQAETIIREIVKGRDRRRSQYSAAIQFHIELISLIQKDSGEKCLESSPTTGKNSWLHAAWKCISSSSFQNAFPNFSTTSEGYNALDSSGKLMLLNFLCDEALNTESLRSWIEEEFVRSLEQEKQSKEKVAAAKEHKRIAKRRMQDELAKAIIAKSGAPLTISEHEAIVSQIKSKTEEAHSQMLEAKGAFPNSKPRSNAVRTEPLFVDTNGNTFWRLKGCSDELGILLQETKEADGIVQTDHWLSFDVEQTSTLEKYIQFRKQKKKSKDLMHVVLSCEQKRLEQGPRLLKQPGKRND